MANTPQRKITATLGKTMSQSDFRLKQFGIQQSQTAMRVSTDAIALASWTTNLALEARHILDVGAGTGILSLMLAQHFAQAHITALEIDNGAYSDMLRNFASSPWAERLLAIQTDALNFDKQQAYDLIISNPPFYACSNPKAQELSRQLARNEAECGLGVKSLIAIAKTLLKPDGALAMICPIDRESDLRQSACEALMYIEQICTFCSSPDVPIRLLVLLRPQQKHKGYCPSRRSILIQRDSTGTYTPQYQSLTNRYLLD